MLQQRNPAEAKHDILCPNCREGTVDPNRERGGKRKGGKAVRKKKDRRKEPRRHPIIGEARKIEL